MRTQHPLAVWCLLALGVLLGIGNASLRADLIPTFNTGVGPTGTPLPTGASDPHWMIVAGPGIVNPVPAVVVTNQNQLGLYAQSSASRWVWVNAGATGAANVPTTFRLTFDLTGFQPATAAITGN